MNIDSKKLNIGNISIGGKDYDVFIAKSQKQKEQGLQFFSELPDDEGMLFINEKPEDVWYHMKNVMTPLDLIFMDDEMKVISVKHGKPNDPTPIEEKNVTFVLEISDGSHIKEGDEAEFDDEKSDAVMKVLAPDGTCQMELMSGERIVSRRETKVLVRKALKAQETKEDSDYKALGKYMFKVLKGQNERPAEYVEAPKKEN